jgi:hypothetical protein
VTPLSLLEYKESTSPYPCFTIIIGYILISFFIVSPIVHAYGLNEQSYDTRFDFISFVPSIQLPGKPVNISCILYPSSDIIEVKIVLTDPSRKVTRIPMTDEMNGRYSHHLVGEIKGKYWFFIEADTRESGLFQSALYSFWISSSYEDKDSDNMQDLWEMENGLNPENPYDAAIDSDFDGYTNREEFIMHTDPMRNNMFQNVLYQLNEKQSYLFISFILCFMVCFFSWYGMRRMII